MKRIWITMAKMAKKMKKHPRRLQIKSGSIQEEVEVTERVLLIVIFYSAALS